MTVRNNVLLIIIFIVTVLAKTVTMKIIIKSTLFLTVITKQLCNGLLIMPRRLKKCNR